MTWTLTLLNGDMWPLCVFDLCDPTSSVAGLHFATGAGVVKMAGTPEFAAIHKDSAQVCSHNLSQWGFPAMDRLRYRAELNVANVKVPLEWLPDNLRPTLPSPAPPEDAVSTAGPLYSGGSSHGQGTACYYCGSACYCPSKYASA